MLDTLKETGKTIGRKIGHEIGRAWDDLSDGWREIFNRGSHALTHFAHNRNNEPATTSPPVTYPHWGLLAGEVRETDDEIVVCLEIPGIEKDDCRVTIEDGMLYLNGEKHFEHASDEGAYHVMERAYGTFQRAIPLPGGVRQDKVEATCRNGVLTVRLLKDKETKQHSIPVD